jgi:hypothetical protein
VINSKLVLLNRHVRLSGEERQRAHGMMMSWAWARLDNRCVNNMADQLWRSLQLAVTVSVTVCYAYWSLIVDVYIGLLKYFCETLSMSCRVCNDNGLFMMIDDTFCIISSRWQTGQSRVKVKSDASTLLFNHNTETGSLAIQTSTMMPQIMVSVLMEETEVCLV